MQEPHRIGDDPSPARLPPRRARPLPTPPLQRRPPSPSHPCVLPQREFEARVDPSDPQQAALLEQMRQHTKLLQRSEWGKPERSARRNWNAAPRAKAPPALDDNYRRAPLLLACCDAALLPMKRDLEHARRLAWRPARLPAMPVEVGRSRCLVAPCGGRQALASSARYVL